MVSKVKNRKELLQEWDAHCEFVQNSTESKLPIQTYKEKQAMKQQMLKDPVVFKSMLFPHYCTLPDSPKHKMLNRELAKYKKITQFRTAFRGFAKSVDATITMPLYTMFKGENKVCAIISENQDKAQVLLSSLQAELEANELINYYFGQETGFGSWKEEQFITKSGSLFKCFGINQSIHGLRYRQHRLSFAVADDFDKQEFAGNPKRVAKYAYEIFGNAKAAFEGSEFKRLVIAQNYKIKGGVLEKLFDEMGKAPSTKIHIINVVDSKGRPTWRERYDEEGLEELKKEYAPKAFNSEFMNQPSSEDGIIHEDWVRFGKTKKWNKYSALFIHWDLSYKATGDHKAAALVGIDRETRKIYVLDVFCRQCDLDTAMNYHFDIEDKCKELGVLLISSFDATASQREVYTPLWRKAAVARGYFKYPEARNAPNQDKYLRIEATLATPFFQGNVIFNEKLEGQPETKQAIHQLTSADKGSNVPDDFPDALEESVRKATNSNMAVEDIKNMKAFTGKSYGRRGNRKRKGF